MSNLPSNPMVNIVDAAPGGRAACVRVTGDVDARGEADLARMAVPLPATHCRRVYVDLAGITAAPRAPLPIRLALIAATP
jgi:hypothetical protein